MLLIEISNVYLQKGLGGASRFLAPRVVFRSATESFTACVVADVWFEKVEEG